MKTYFVILFIMFSCLVLVFGLWCVVIPFLIPVNATKNSKVFYIININNIYSGGSVALNTFRTCNSILYFIILNVHKFKKSLSCDFIFC